MATTIKDIARICGVGVSTVSRAMNNHPDINTETRDMIMETIKKYNYVPNNSARNLKRTDSKTIAVLIKGIANPFFSKIVEVIEQETQKKKYSFILQRVEENENELDIAIELVKEKKLKGIIFLGGIISHSNEKLSQLTVPFVLCATGFLQEGKVREEIKGSYVSVDDYMESYKMTDYLCKLGHKKIAILAANVKDDSIGMLRFRGYKKALEDNGISFDEELTSRMSLLTDCYTLSTGYRLMKQLLEKRQDFTAVYAIADSLAIGASKAIHEAGKEIPKDYSLVGFDGLEMGEYINPALTTIRQPVEEMGRQAVTLLFQRIKKAGKFSQVVLPGELVIRDSAKEVKMEE